MARSKFIREKSRHGWQLFWREGFDEECCDYTDAPLGQGRMAGTPEPPAGNDWETWAAENAAKPYVVEIDSMRGFIFDTEADAKMAQFAADAAIAKAPLEEWETKALAAGWKPPNGWRKQA